MEILKLENLTFTYQGALSPAVDGINLTVNKGELTVIAGATGSGKSTLLRLLKRELAPRGKRSGEVLYNGAGLEDLTEAEAAFNIGFVMQRPEQQIVTDKVWHELAFGLESMGLSNEDIARRVAEMSSYYRADRNSFLILLPLW